MWAGSETMIKGERFKNIYAVARRKNLHSIWKGPGELRGGGVVFRESPEVRGEEG